MNVIIRKAEDRGDGSFSWLTSKHSFSFGDYFDPENMSFGALRVINDDTISPHSGFPDHSHRNMEIFTIPLSGTLRHTDSLGNSTTVAPGDIQIMSAGSGVTHSEYNASDTDPLSLLQIWVEPHTLGIPARHEERHFPFLEEDNTLHEVINPTGENGALKIFQESYVSLGTFYAAQTVSYTMHSKNNGLFVFVIEGSVMVDEKILEKRDAMEITQEESISLYTKERSYILLIEVPLL
jgi:hypothetical protein